MKGRRERSWPCATDLNRNGVRHFGIGGMNSWKVASGAHALPSRIGGRGKPRPYRGSGVAGEGVGGCRRRSRDERQRGTTKDERQKTNAKEKPSLVEAVRAFGAQVTTRGLPRDLLVVGLVEPLRAFPGGRDGTADGQHGHRRQRAGSRQVQGCGAQHDRRSAQGDGAGPGGHLRRRAMSAQWSFVPKPRCRRRL